MVPFTQINKCQQSEDSSHLTILKNVENRSDNIQQLFMFKKIKTYQVREEIYLNKAEEIRTVLENKNYFSNIYQSWNTHYIYTKTSTSYYLRLLGFEQDMDICAFNPSIHPRWQRQAGFSELETPGLHRQIPYGVIQSFRLVMYLFILKIQYLVFAPWGTIFVSTAFSCQLNHFNHFFDKLFHPSQLTFTESLSSDLSHT